MKRKSFDQTDADVTLWRRDAVWGPSSSSRPLKR